MYMKHIYTKFYISLSNCPRPASQVIFQLQTYQNVCPRYLHLGNVQLAGKWFHNIDGGSNQLSWLQG